MEISYTIALRFLKTLCFVVNDQFLIANLSYIFWKTMHDQSQILNSFSEGFSLLYGYWGMKH